MNNGDSEDMGVHVRGASPPISQWLLSGEFALAGDLA